MSIPLELSFHREPKSLFTIHSISKDISNKVQHTIQLKPNTNVLIGIAFNPPSYKQDNYLQLWPLVAKTQLNGKFSIIFNNGVIQSVDMTCILYRPMIQLSTTYHHFGIVHVDLSINDPNNIMDLYITNISMTDACWNIMHIPYPIEEEDDEEEDDEEDEMMKEMNDDEQEDEMENNLKK